MGRPDAVGRASVWHGGDAAANSKAALRWWPCGAPDQSAQGNLRHRPSARHRRVGRGLREWRGAARTASRGLRTAPRPTRVRTKPGQGDRGSIPLPWTRWPPRSGLRQAEAPDNATRARMAESSPILRLAGLPLRPVRSGASVDKEAVSGNHPAQRRSLHSQRVADGLHSGTLPAAGTPQQRRHDGRDPRSRQVHTYDSTAVSQVRQSNFRTPSLV